LRHRPNDPAIDSGLVSQCPSVSQYFSYIYLERIMLMFPIALRACA